MCSYCIVFFLLEGVFLIFVFADLVFVQLSIIAALISLQGSKRSRTGVTELLSTATNIPVQDAYMSDFGSMEVNNSTITGVGNDPIGSYWDWDDDDRGMEMDIQALLSEFGDFGDFFENDVLPFGEVSEYLYYDLKRISSFDFHFFLLYNPEF